MAVCGPTSGGSKIGELIVRGRFEADDDEVNLPNLVRRARAARACVEVSFRTSNLHAASTDDFVVRPQQKVNLLAVTPQLRAVVAPQRSAAYDGDFHTMVGG